MDNMIRIQAAAHQTELHRAAVEQRPTAWSAEHGPRSDRQAPRMIRLMLHRRSTGATRKQAPVPRVSL